MLRAFLAAFAVVFLWAGAALAGPTAEELKAQADAAFDARHYQEALTLYDQSYALSPQPAIFYNRGRVFQYLGQYPRAEQELERFVAEAPADLRAKVTAFDSVLADVKRHVARVRIVCPVANAHILVGSMDVGVTPLASAVMVNAGEQRIDVIAEGYYPFHETRNLPGGTTTDVSIALASRDRHALLVVRSPLIETSIAIDDKVSGIAPIEATVDEGTHHIRASRDGYSDATTQILVRAGERRELELSPTKRPAVTSRWWFWTTIGLVVAGGVAATLTYAFTTERSASIGTFNPGQLHF